MKSINNIYHSLEELRTNLDLSNLDPRKTLVQVFSGLVDLSSLQEIQEIFKQKNPNINFLGTSTAGEIVNAKCHEHSIVVSITTFDHTFVEIKAFCAEDEFSLGQDIAQNFFKQNTKACIMFFESLNTNCSDILDGLSKANKLVPIAGGLAGDYASFVQTYIFDNEKIYSKGCLAAILNSDVLSAVSGYQLNWEPIGKIMEVTKVDKKRLYEIDDLNIKDLYLKYYGEDIAKQLPFITEEFPLFEIRDDKREMFHFFTKLFAQDGSVLTIANLKKGDKVKLSFGNAFSVLNKTIENLKQIEANKEDVVFIYNCASRKQFLADDANLELEPFKTFKTSVGFYCHGELCSSDVGAFVLNMSMTYLILNENSLPIKMKNDTKLQYKFTDSKRYAYAKALVNLTNQIINELQDAKEKLRNQANKDYLTGLYNRRYLDKVAKELMVKCKQNKKGMNIIVLDIDNFKLINDTYGHLVGDEVIKTLANILQENTRKNDVVLRLGGEEFGVLLPCSTSEETFGTAEKLRKLIASSKVDANHTYINFTVSLGVDNINFDKDISVYQALDRADSALYDAKRSGKNCTILYKEKEVHS